MVKNDRQIRQINTMEFWIKNCGLDKSRMPEQRKVDSYMEFRRNARDISKETLAAQTVQDLLHMKYFSKDVIIGCIQTIRYRHNYNCQASNGEVYELVVRNLTNLGLVHNIK